MEFKDYYRILGVRRDATAAEIKQAFRRLARQYHPDVARDKRAAEERFKEINEAHEVLGDPARRQRYDELGAHWRAGEASAPGSGRRGNRSQRRRPNPTGEEFTFHFGEGGFSDFFEEFFGRNRGFSDTNGFRSPSGDEADEPARGADLEGTVEVTLEEALHGATRKLSREGHGEDAGHPVTVRIPPGVRDGQRIRVAGQGESGPANRTRGDLYLRVRFAPHPDLRPEGDHLHHELKLAPWEAVLGATVSVPTLDGPVSVRIPAGTAAGHTLRLRGRGLPGGPDQPRGDLLVAVSIQVPTRIPAAERARWEELARHSTFDPRRK